MITLASVPYILYNASTLDIKFYIITSPSSVLQTISHKYVSLHYSSCDCCQSPSQPLPSTSTSPVPTPSPLLNHSTHFKTLFSKQTPQLIWKELTPGHLCQKVIGKVVFRLDRFDDKIFAVSQVPSEDHNEFDLENKNEVRR